MFVGLADVRCLEFVLFELNLCMSHQKRLRFSPIEYYIESSAVQPPTSGWVVARGADPAPTIKYI